MTEQKKGGLAGALQSPEFKALPASQQISIMREINAAQNFMFLTLGLLVGALLTAITAIIVLTVTDARAGAGMLLFAAAGVALAVASWFAADKRAVRVAKFLTNLRAEKAVNLR